MNNKGYKKKIEARITSFMPDTVFVINDFADIADNEIIRQTLKQQVDAGVIHRIIPGVFHKQKFNKTLNENVPPSIRDIAYAIARARKWTIAPTGEAALNALGLSTQVPMTWIYISDGPYARFEIRRSIISFKHSANRDVTQLSATTLLIVQALKALGKDDVDERVIEKLSDRLTNEQKDILLKESTRVTVWVRSALRKISETS